MNKVLKVLAAFSVLASGVALAEQPTSSGLGQSWPNARDVSASAHYHVYVFVKDGIRFIQVNDTSGRVRGALATAGGEMLVLPIGSDAQVVTPSTPAAAAPVAPATPGETVYQDGQVTITAQPQRTGTLLLNAASRCQDPVTCNTQVNSLPR